MRQHSGKLGAAFVVFMVLLIINMKKNMEFDQFDKRTATERLQLYEDALVVYALLYKITKSPETVAVPGLFVCVIITL